MPEPTANESREQFFDRCMVDPEAIASFPEAGQRGGFCSAQWNAEAQQESVRLQASAALSKLNQLSAPHLDSFLVPAREALAAASVAAPKSAPMPAPAAPVVEATHEDGDMLDTNDALGAHAHGLTVDGEAELGGEHQHIFRLPDGTLIQTDVSGEHKHEGPGEPGTPHKHKVTLPNGTELETVEWQDPGHAWLANVTTWNSPHPHDINLPGGETVSSLTSADVREADDINTDPEPIQESLHEAKASVRKVGGGYAVVQGGKQVGFHKTRAAADKCAAARNRM